MTNETTNLYFFKILCFCFNYKFISFYFGEMKQQLLRRIVRENNTRLTVCALNHDLDGKTSMTEKGLFQQVYVHSYSHITSASLFRGRCNRVYVFDKTGKYVKSPNCSCLPEILRARLFEMEDKIHPTTPLHV